MTCKLRQFSMHLQIGLKEQSTQEMIVLYDPQDNNDLFQFLRTVILCRRQAVELVKPTTYLRIKKHVHFWWNNIQILGYCTLSYRRHRCLSCASANMFELKDVISIVCYKVTQIGAISFGQKEVSFSSLSMNIVADRFIWNHLYYLQTH